MSEEVTSHITNLKNIIKTSSSLLKFKDYLDQNQILENEIRESRSINTFIALSIQHQKYEIFQYLIDIIIPTIDETSFIDYKIRKTSMETLKLFVYIAIKYYNGFDGFIRYLISVKKIPIHSIIINIAAKNGYIDIVKYLFDNGSIVNIKSIHVASENGHFDIVYFLMNKISNDCSLIYSRTINNIFLNGPLYLIEFILNINKSINTKNINIDKYSIRLLFEHGRKDIIKSLIEKNLLPDIGPYAVRDAYENKHYDLVEFLLKHRFPVDITSDFIIECSNSLKKEGIIVNNIPYY